MKLYFVVNNTTGVLKQHVNANAIGYKKKGTAKQVASYMNKKDNTTEWVVKYSNIKLKDLDD